MTTYYASQLKQAPDNLWRVISATNYYGVKRKPLSVVKEPSNILVDKSTITGSLVYLKGSDGSFTPYIKTGTSSYPYIPVKLGNRLIVEPYYVWVLKNEKLYKDEKPELISKAKSKLSNDVLAAIKSGEYSYALDSATAGQIDLDVANYELLDEVRYSVNAIGRNNFKVKRGNTKIYIFDKEIGVLIASNKTLERGKSISAKGIVNRTFKYKLPEMLNVQGNIFIPVSNLKKIDDGYLVNTNTKALSIHNGQIYPSSELFSAGTAVKGDVVQPVVQKNFSFLILEDNPQRTVFVKKRDVNELVSDFIGEMDIIEGKDRLFNAWDNAINFEGGDIEDFYGGDVNFCCIDGTEKVIGFDSNADIPSDIFDNTGLYFNSDGVGDYANNTEIDLSFSGVMPINAQLTTAYSNFLGKLFKKKDKKVTEEQAKKIADKEKVEYTPDEVEIIYQKSGSRKPFGEWLKSNDAKVFLSAIEKIGHQLLTGKAGGKAEVDDDDDNDKGTGSDDKQILGMHPVTFGVVSIGALLLVGLGTWLIVTKTKSK